LPNICILIVLRAGSGAKCDIKANSDQLKLELGLSLASF
jgi:hypothetical protein